MTLSETDILLAKKGDRMAFARVYDESVRSVYGFIYTKVHHTQTAEDLTSLAFTKALEHIGAFDSKKASFATWLFTIARRVVIDHYRTKRIDVHIEDAWDLPSTSDIPRDTDMLLRLESVKTAMKELSAQDRDLLVLHLWQDLTFSEISEIVGRSPDACKVAYGRAVSKLRSRLPGGVSLFLVFLYSLSV